MGEQIIRLLSSLARPRVAFWLALAVLLPVQVVSVVGDGWFLMPPKPDGDGLEYENIGFHLWRAAEYAVRNKDPDWLTIYRAQPELYREHLSASSRNMLTTGRPPVFPTLVAAVYAMLGRTETGFGLIRLISAVCLALAGALAVWLTAWLVSGPLAAGCKPSSVFVSAVGIAATIFLAATQRTLKSYAHDFLTEPLALLLMQCFVISIIFCQGHLGRAERTEAAVSLRMGAMFIACGSVFGVLVLTRSIFVAWLPGVWLIAYLASRQHAFMAAVHASSLVAGIVLVCLPWWIRNVCVLGEFMPLGTQGSITLLGAYSDEGLAAGGDWQFAPEQRLRAELGRDPAFIQLNNDEQREIVVARVAKTEVAAWTREHLAQLPGLFISKVITHWNPYTGRSLVWKLLVLAGACALVVLPGRFFPASSQAVGWWLLGLPLLSTLVAGSLYTTGGRFLVPLYGVLFSLGGIGAAAVVGWLRSAISHPQFLMKWNES